jgi:D-alanyl-D-alanine carboxypeptidase (penicillin-binding protein 5/6)
MMRGKVIATSAVIVAALLAGDSAAQTKTVAVDGSAQPYKAALLMHADSGTILFEENAHLRLPPASMTKMMVMLIAAERVQGGAATWEDAVTTSRWASKMGGSQVYLREGETFTLAEMMQAIVIHSANDASVAVAEYLGGSSDAFVDLMNERARALGLKDTIYRGPHGLPPAKGQEPDLTTAHDLALLAREILKHPDLMKWAATKEAPFRGGRFIMRNTNHLVRNTNWVDGLKTGYYREAGFGVTATATRGDVRLVAVILGTPHKKQCFDEAARLLNRGFASYKLIYAVRQGDVVGNDVPVRRGKPKFVRVVAGGDIKVLAQKTEDRSFDLELVLSEQLVAPLVTHTAVGSVVVKEGGKEIGRVPALTADPVEKATGFLDRFL